MKKRITINIDSDLLKMVDETIKFNKWDNNRSRLIEDILKKELMNNYED